MYLFERQYSQYNVTKTIKAVSNPLKTQTTRATYRENQCNRSPVRVTCARSEKNGTCAKKNGACSLTGLCVGYRNGRGQG